MTIYCIFILLFSGTAPGRSLSPGTTPDQTIITARVGDNATLPCFYQDSDPFSVLWYQQKLGATPRLISSSFTYVKKAKLHKDFENDSRFSVQRGPGVNHLTITHLRLSDSATYYCGVSDMTAVEYRHGIFLHVKTPKTDKQPVIRQGWTAALLPGNSVNLSCEVSAAERCSGDHSIYWYRAGGAQPALLYANTDVCEGPPALKTCTFHLPMADLRAVDAGTYYCVLSLCGEILFGNGTTVDIVELCYEPIVIYILGAALAVTLILAVVLAVVLTSLLISRTSRPCGCRGELPEPENCTAAKEVHDYEVDSLVYVAVSAENSRRRGRRHSADTECVYSAVQVRN